MVVGINEGINPALHLAAVGDSSSPDGFDLEHRPERTAKDPERKVVNLERTDQRPEGEFLSDVVPHMFGELHGGGVVTPSIFGVGRFAEADIPPIPNGTHNFLGIEIRSHGGFPDICVEGRRKERDLGTVHVRERDGAALDNLTDKISLEFGTGTLEH